MENKIYPKYGGKNEENNWFRVTTMSLVSNIMAEIEIHFLISGYLFRYLHLFNEDVAILSHPNKNVNRKQDTVKSF